MFKNNYNISKNFEITFLNIIIIFTIFILFLKFFLLYPIYPSSDEILSIERFTKPWTFLRKNEIANHTINSFIAVLIKSLFGPDILYYRFISFLCFCLIIFFFKKLYPNILAYCFFILLVLSSSVLTAYIYIFRGYYTWAFFVVLNFYFLKKYIQNNFDNKNYNIILFLNLIMACHALFTLYTVIPTLSVIFCAAIIRKDLKKIYNFFIFFFLPLVIYYFVVCVLEGFVNSFSGNLTLDYLINNFFNVVKIGFPIGFKAIFLSEHMYGFSVQENLFILAIKSLLHSNDPEYSILLIFIISFSILLIRILKKKINLIDLIILFMLFFFYIAVFVPEIRVYFGISFFLMFYIFENVFIFLVILNKWIKLKYFFATILIFFFLFKVNPPDEKLSIHTKYEIINIRSLKNFYSCKELNDILNQHEIWIFKNIFTKDCSSRYDFINNKNILF